MSALSYIFYNCIASPIFEEVFYRGIIYKKFTNKDNKRLAMIVSSVLFSSMHSELHTKIASLLFGLMMCYLLDRYDNIKLNILVHMLANIVGMSFLFLLGRLDYLVVCAISLFCLLQMWFPLIGRTLLIILLFWT